jgi:ribose transport system substrate-binding protein
MRSPHLLHSAALLGSLALILTPLLSCGRAHEAEEKYYLVITNKQLPYWKTAASGFFAAARQLNVKSEIAGPDDYNPQQQASEFRRVAQQKPSGILVSAADAELLKPEIDAALQAGVPVITMDADSPSSKRLYFIGTNNYQAGLTGGEYAAKLLNGAGNVVVFTMPGQKNLDERLQGYRQAFANTRIKITEVVDIKGDSRIAFDKAEELIGKKAPIQAFVCLEASAGRDVASVLERNNAKKVLMAMDTDEGTIDWLQKGWISATIAQKPWTMAFVGVKMLDNFHHNQPGSLNRDWSKDSMAPLPAFVDTGSFLIDKSNVAEFLAANKDQESK